MCIFGLFVFAQIYLNFACDLEKFNVKHFCVLLFTGFGLVFDKCCMKKTKYFMVVSLGEIQLLSKKTEQIHGAQQT